MKFEVNKTTRLAKCLLETRLQIHVSSRKVLFNDKRSRMSNWHSQRKGQSSPVPFHDARVKGSIVNSAQTGMG